MRIVWESPSTGSEDIREADKMDAFWIAVEGFLLFVFSAAMVVGFGLLFQPPH